MYKMRDIAILGGGGFLAILCLILPLGLAGKIVCAGIVLVAALVVDRLPVKAGLTIDKMLTLRMRKAGMPKKYNREAGERSSSWREEAGHPAGAIQQTAPARPVILVPPMDEGMDALPPAPVYVYNPLLQAAGGLTEGTLGVFITVVLLVVAAYFFYWLYTGGLQTLTADFATILSWTR
jgi:hypothetical protein